MRIRLAKKILYTKLYGKKHHAMRPPYVDERGRTVFPSWHDIPEVKKAWTRYRRWLGCFKPENKPPQD